jgi:phosphoglycerate dehydrogenase-like enzyme
MKQVTAAFFNSGASFRGGNIIDYVYARGRREQVAAMTDLYPVVINADNFREHADKLAGVEVIFSTWGMPVLAAADLERLPALRAVFYAAGSVQGFARPFLARRVTVCSAWGANAVSVAEFCLAQVLLACKGYFRNTHDCRVPECNRPTAAFQGRGAYGEKVAIIGAGQIGRRLIGLLKPFRLEVLVVDPYLSVTEAEELNVRKVSLDEAFREAYVVSNHLPNLPTLQRVLDGRLFESMRPDATFINTGRGAQVNEPDLIDVLRRRPDLQVLLDVTDPEPPPAGSGFYDLPNVRLSGHMAGAHDDEVVRMADFMIEEFGRWQAGEALHYAVTLEMLERMA